MTVEEALTALRSVKSPEAESFKMDLACAPYWNMQLTATELELFNVLVH
jgi:hypothetical protein